MKKSVAIGIAIGGVLLIGVFAIVFVLAREPISLTFLQYPAGRHGAKLKLTNNSRKTITYVTERAGWAILSLQKTATGWTNTSPRITSGTWTDANTGKTRPIYLSGEPRTFLRTHELLPGESAELFVWLEADGPPMRVGTMCIVPQGKLAQQFGRWMDRVKRWCRMKPTAPGLVEVWCKEPLQLPLSPTDGTNHYDL